MIEKTVILQEKVKAINKAINNQMMKGLNNHLSMCLKV